MSSAWQDVKRSPPTRWLRSKSLAVASAVPWRAASSARTVLRKVSKTSSGSQ